MAAGENRVRPGCTRIWVYLCTGILVYWCASVTVYQCIGVPVYLWTRALVYQTFWCTRVLVSRGIGVPVYRYTSVLVYMCTSAPVYRCTVYLCTGEPVYQSTLVPVYYHNDVPVHQCMHPYSSLLERSGPKWVKLGINFMAKWHIERVRFMPFFTGGRVLWPYLCAFFIFI